jgi:aryl-alcohol dehydrogenase-like predicted oxidoreductase
VAILGGAAFWGTDPAITKEAFDAALAAGVNHLDVAPQYGRAQELLGPLVPAVRDDLFVACKTLRRDPDGVRAQLDESLRLLGCEYFDLYQLHAVTDVEELDARRGAVEAVLEARDDGRCRFAGITGHGLDTPAAQLEALRRYDLDTVMFPVNPQLWSDSSYRRDAEALLELAEERDLGVMAIKAVAARPWAGRTPTTTTWYEPYTGREEVARGVGFALSTPRVQALCTPSDLGLVSLLLELLGGDASVGLNPDAREAASAATRHEPSIFPMPVG